MDSEDTDINAREGEVFLCHNCLAENPPEAHFCSACNSPLSTYSAYDPLMQINASGDTYIKATTGKPSWIKTIGVLLIFGPLALTGLFQLIAIIGQFPEDIQVVSVQPWWESMAGFLGYGIMSVMTFVPLLVIVKSVFRHRRPRRR